MATGSFPGGDATKRLTDYPGFIRVRIRTSGPEYRMIFKVRTGNHYDLIEVNTREKTRYGSKTASTWRGFQEGDEPFWQQHDAVIATQRRGRDRYYEVWYEGKNFVNRPTLEEAKAAVEGRVGRSLNWRQTKMPKVNVLHYWYGPTVEFTDPLTIYTADFS